MAKIIEKPMHGLKNRKMRETALGLSGISGMSDPKQERESLTGWTLVDREGTPEVANQQETTTPTDEAKDGGGEGEEESGCGMEEEDEESLPDDLVTMGQRVQEIKASPSGSDFSDIETLECPGGEEDSEEDRSYPYDPICASLLSSASHTGFTFVNDADEDVESLASTDISILDGDERKEKALEEEEDLSLASSPSLPDNLPAIRPDTQYKHTPDRELSTRLNVVVALTLACVLGLGLGHFLGWSSRTVWQENLNSAQVRRLRELQDDLVSCMSSPTPPHSPSAALDFSDQYQPEADHKNNNPESSFMPVLPQATGDSALHIESFVESIVVPLEDAGVILSPSRRKSGASYMSVPHTIESESTDPTFATPDILYNKQSVIPVVGKDLDLDFDVSERLSNSPEAYTTTDIEENVPSSPEDPDSAWLSSIAPPSKINPLFESWPSTESQLLHPAFPRPPSSVKDAFEAAEEDLASDSPTTLTVEPMQIIEALTTENTNMKSKITRLQQETIAPIKIGGKEGKMARELRERINILILDNEELRMAIGKLQFTSFPDADKDAINVVLKNNYNLRIAVSKLTHLGPNLSELQVSTNDLQAENQELQIQVGKLRYQQQPLPQELNAVAREIENMKYTVNEVSMQKKTLPGLENTKTYVSYMSQILSGIQTLHQFGEGSFAEKVDAATDVFEDLVPGNIKMSTAMQQKMNIVRTKFDQIQDSLVKKWKKVKELSQPERIVDVGRDTLSKMNRVIVNVVNKMKEIGQTSIMNRGKASLDKTITTLADRFTALGAQFDNTWSILEAETVTEEEIKNGDKTVSVSEDIKDEEIPVPVVTPTSMEAEEEEVAVTIEVDTVDEQDSEGVLEAEVEVTSQVGKGGKRGGGGGGGDKKRQPEYKKYKKVNKKEEEKKKKEAKQKKSRRTKVKSSEEKKAKKEKAVDKKGSTETKEKMKENDMSQDSRKHGKSRDTEGSSDRRDGNRDVQEDNKKYYKGQYNKYDKKRSHYDDDDNDRYTFKRNNYDDDDDDDDDKKYRKKHYGKDHDDDNDDDDNDDEGYRHTIQQQARRGNDDDEKKKGVMRHWQKPSRKNSHREFTGPKKAFIKRRGKNLTQTHHSHEQWGDKRVGRQMIEQESHKSDWVFDRARERSQKREMERKADWQFDRARDRSNRREMERMADWQFDRAHGRKEMRYVVEDKKEQLQDHNKYGHNKYEDPEAKRRYVRFDDDDDNDGNDDYQHYHNRQGKMKYDHRRNDYPKTKGQREWVIPNFSASGKAFYR